MVGLLHIVALGLYLAVAGVLVSSLLAGKEGAPVAVAFLALAAVLAHAGGIAAYAARWGELPLVGLGPSLTMLGLLVGVFLLPAVALRRKAGPVGLVLAPLAAVLIIIAMIVGIAPTGEPLAFRGPWFATHVVLAFLADACLAASFAAGLLYLIQLRELKGKNFGNWFRFLPPLETLERFGRGALWVGFPALTLAIALAWAWTMRFRHSFEVRQPEVIWGIITWVVFLVALLARTGNSGRERRGAVASVVGFTVVVLAYVVLRLSMTAGRFFF